MTQRLALIALALSAALSAAGCVEAYSGPRYERYQGYSHSYSRHNDFSRHNGYGNSYSNHRYEQERRHRAERDCPKRDTRWYQPWRSSRAC